jgi:TPR repeat protein
MTPEEWLAKKAKEFARQQVLNIADKLSDTPQQPATNEEASPSVPSTGRMGNIDGKDVPELLAVSAVDVPENSPDSEFILRGLPDFGKALLKLDAARYAFKEEPPPKPKLVAPPPPPPPPPVKQEVKKKANDTVVGAIFVALVFLGYYGYKSLSKPDYKEPSASASYSQPSPPPATTSLPELRSELPAGTSFIPPNLRLGPTAPAAPAKPVESEAQPSTASLLQTGDNYHYGINGVTINESSANEWYKKASDLGDLDAKVMLAFNVLYDEARKSEMPAARAIIESAAKAGNVRATNMLANMYRFGDNGYEKNPAEAFRLYQIASDRRFFPAQANLAELILETNTKARFAEAATLLFLAAGEGSVWARLSLSKAYANGDNALGIVKSPKQAFDWAKTAADQGQPEAQLELGNMYFNGVGVAINQAAALELYRKAAAAGLAAAQTNLGVMYQGGLGGLPKSNAEATRWYRMAINRPNPQPLAEYNLGKLLLEDPSGKYLGEGASLITSAAGHGDPSAKKYVDNLPK